MNGIFTLNVQDFLRGLVMAVFTAVVTVVYGAVTTPGFDIFHADWGQIGMLAANVGVIAMIAYLGKNFVSDSSGKVFGKI